MSAATRFGCGEIFDDTFIPNFPQRVRQWRNFENPLKIDCVIDICLCSTFLEHGVCIVLWLSIISCYFCHVNKHLAMQFCMPCRQNVLIPCDVWRGEEDHWSCQQIYTDWGHSAAVRYRRLHPIRHSRGMLRLKTGSMSTTRLSSQINASCRLLWKVGVVNYSIIIFFGCRNEWLFDWLIVKN